MFLFFILSFYGGTGKGTRPVPGILRPVFNWKGTPGGRQLNGRQVCKRQATAAVSNCVWVCEPYFLLLGSMGLGGSNILSACCCVTKPTHAHTHTRWRSKVFKKGKRDEEKEPPSSIFFLNLPHISRRATFFFLSFFLTWMFTLAFSLFTFTTFYYVHNNNNNKKKAKKRKKKRRNKKGGRWENVRSLCLFLDVVECALYNEKHVCVCVWV